MSQSIQVARPVSDDLVGHWSPTPVYPHVNGVSPNDPGAVSTSNLTQGDAFEVKLRGLAWPAPGAEVLSVRLAGDGVTPVTVVLLQGSQVIAFATVTPPSTFQTYTLTLSAAQVAQLSNYADLHVKVVGPVQTPCCANALPALLHLSGPSSLAVTLTWDGSTYWTGTSPDGNCTGGTRHWRFYCAGVDFALATLCTGTFWTLIHKSSPPDTTTCNPLVSTFGARAYTVSA
jgi:hypothetical protein